MEVKSINYSNSQQNFGSIYLSKNAKFSPRQKVLANYVKDLIQETGKYHASYDLWEMCEGTHLYSLSAIYCAFGAEASVLNVSPFV